MIVANNGLGLNMNMIHTTSAPQLRPFHCLDFSVKKSNSLSFVLGCWTSNSASPSKNKNSKNPKSFCCLCSNSNNSDTNNNNNNSSCLGWDWNRGTRHFSEIEQAESYASVLKPQPHMRRHSKLMEFPHLSASHKELMAGIISALETRLQSELLPSSVVPPDVEYYQNETGLSQGTLHIRRGLQSSHIDFMLASWLHLQQPNGGGAMNVTNLQVYLKPSINVPHFQLELVQCTPSYMIFFVDLTPRKDLVVNPDYLKTFYEETQLDVYRQKLDQVPEIKPYFSSSLYFRGVVSPTGILVSIKCEDGDGGKDRCEEIIRENVSPIAYEVMRIWMDKYLYFVGERMSVSEIERGEMEKRDGLIKRRAIEMDLSLMMPKQFGDEVGNRVLGFIKDVFNV